jgi:hypothetical protein
MVEEIVAHISDAIDAAKAKPATRELSLVITKLEEALLWYKEHVRRASKSNS